MFATASADALLHGGSNWSSQFTWLDRTGKAAGTFGGPGEYVNFDLSPDGRRVVVARPSSSGFDLWLVETERDVWSRFTFSPGILVPYPVPEWPFDRVPVSPEPSPRWVAYTSDESGHNEVYVQAFPEPRGKWQISAGGGASPEWNPGGHELFYLASGNKLRAVKLNLGVDSVEPLVARELARCPPTAQPAQAGRRNLPGSA